MKDETTEAYADRVNRNMNYMMPDYNVRTTLSFSYSSALVNMYEQLREVSGATIRDTLIGVLRPLLKNANTR